ncbi:hypothetical protein B0H13DRAFT_2414051 [Mycena leptocephala]|nr:hypothetical protein B0H13DRAFT_2414051 [Mycena leptocephala]
MQSKTKPNPHGHRRKALQSHVAFFDPDQDGISGPSTRTYLLSSLSRSLLDAILSDIRIPRDWVRRFLCNFGDGLHSYWFLVGHVRYPPPRSFFRVRVSHIHHACTAPTPAHSRKRRPRRAPLRLRVLHVLDPAAHTPDIREGVRMLRGNRNVCDLFGWFAAACDWGATYLLLWPSDGASRSRTCTISWILLTRTHVQGSLFPKLAQKIRSANKA